MVSKKQLRNIIAGPEEGIEEFVEIESKARRGFEPSQRDIERWVESVESEMDRIHGSMVNPAMLRMALDFTETEDGGRIVAVRPSGLDYVLTRSKHPETPEGERSELKRVICYCGLVEAVEAAARCIEKGDWVRLNRIMASKGVRA